MRTDTTAIEFDFDYMESPGGFTGWLTKYPAIIAEGDTIDQLKIELGISLNVMFDYLMNHQGQ